MLHAQPPRGLHHVEGADHIGIDIGARVLEAVAHPGLRGEVDDHIGGEVIRDSVELRLILQQSPRSRRTPGSGAAWHGGAA